MVCAAAAGAGIAMLAGTIMADRRPSKGRRLRQTALLVGDSITQYGFAFQPPGEGEQVPAAGWTAIIADVLQRKVDVVNRGLSGYNSRKILAALPRIIEDLPEGNLIFATVFVGANDSQPDSGVADPLCSHVPLKEFKENIIAIIQLLRKKGAQHVLVISPPPVDETKEVMGRRLEITKTYAEQAAAAARDASPATLHLDLFSAFQHHQPWQSLLVDGLHLNGRGNFLLAQLVQGKLTEAGIVEEAPWDFPSWRDLDRFHPKL